MSSASPAFDPYEDRTARDIRNRLSVAFVQAIRSGDFQKFLSAAESICPPETGRVYCAFASDRIIEYRHALETIQAERIAEPIHQAAVLWNQGLFFEVHEILESVWNDEQRWRKEALRGWIQAAGVYIDLQRGAGRAAATLAARAAAHLKAHRRELSEIANIEELVEALTDPDRPAPVLEFMGPVGK